jgi:WD40 repeat protein
VKHLPAGAIGLVPASDIREVRTRAFKEDPRVLCGCNLIMTSHLIYRVTSALPMPTRGDPTVVSISPEGTFIAVGSADGHILVWCSRSYELFCQASPPVSEYESTGICVTCLTWMTNGLLAFSRENGLMSILLVGKVRKPA